MEGMEPVIVALGYTCFCGERVRVFHVTPGTNQLLHPVSVSCPNGHTATFRPEQIASLELWVDEGSTGEENKKTA
jgi:hypothetical protein